MLSCLLIAASIMLVYNIMGSFRLERIPKSMGELTFAFGKHRWVYPVVMTIVFTLLSASACMVTLMHNVYISFMPVLCFIAFVACSYVTSFANVFKENIDNKAYNYILITCLSVFIIYLFGGIGVVMADLPGGYWMIPALFFIVLSAILAFKPRRSIYMLEWASFILIIVHIFMCIDETIG